MSPPVVAIGYILLIPSCLGTSICGYLFLSMMSRPNVSDAARAGAFVFLALGVACFVGGLLVWLLVMKKHVLRCSVCGAVVSAS